MTGWEPIGQGPPPNQLSFQWQNPKTQQGQGTSFKFHPKLNSRVLFHLHNGDLISNNLL
jgi:hypothetical protein